MNTDGSYRGWTSGKLYSSIKEYLDEIKELFGLKNKVIEIIKPGAVMDILGKTCVTKGMNSIRISSRDIFIEMMNSYRDSLARKRPQQILGNSNYLD